MWRSIRAKWLDPEAWSTHDRIHAGVLLFLAAVAVAHQCVLWHWYIEDAAISFAYAKHLAMGEGLVPFIGAERVEGYSNPSWVFFLAPFHLVGFDLHEVTRWLQVFLCVPTVVLSYLSAREILGERSHAALIAPAILAASSQFAIWSSSGLEMALMNALMAMALWRSLVEIRTGSWPWSALWWFFVAISRPEAILYAAVAGFCAMVFQLHARRSLVPTFKWLLTFFLPFGLYHAWRYSYFAWEFPNTYYAKLERRPEMPLLNWGGKSWKYTRDFMLELGWGFFLPVWVLGVLGFDRWRLPLAVVACLLIGGSVELIGDQRFLLALVVGITLVIFWMGLGAVEDEPPLWLATVGLFVAIGLVVLSEILRQGYGMSPNLVPTPDWIETVPPYLLIGLGALLPFLGIGSRWWQGRMLTWLLCMAAVLFALIAQWDWMHGFRWYAPAVVPGSVLFALGAASLATVVQRVLDPVGSRWVIDERWTTRGARAIRLGLALAVLLLVVAGLRYQGGWLATQPYLLEVVIGVAIALYLGVELTVIALVREPATTAHRWTLPGYATAILATLAAVPANALHTKQIAEKPQTKPEHVLARVNYVDRVRDRLHIEERLRDLDVDQGAHLFWSDFEMSDIAGLIDVPLGHHKFERSFVQEYLFEEVKPHFAHVHGGWSTNSRIPTHPQWRNEYLEIPGYVANRTSMHIGNHVRRDTIVADAWPHEPSLVRIDDNLVLQGLHVPSEPAAERKLYLEVGISALKKRKVQADNFRLLFFIANDRGDSHQWELPPGYDWLWPHEWRPEEVFVGKFDLTLPKKLQPGTYDLGLIVIDAEGQVVTPRADAESLPSGLVIGGTSPEQPARIARGEIRFSDALQILTKEERAQAAVADRQAALDLAGEQRCAEAEHHWFLARKHRPTEDEWEAEHRPAVHRALARCHAERSDALEAVTDKVAALVRARELDHWEPTYRDRASTLADELHAWGLEARETGDWEAAYRLFADAVAVDRTRSWSRRYAEEARAYRLGIDKETLAEKEAERKETREANRKKREAVLRERGAKVPAPKEASLERERE